MDWKPSVGLISRLSLPWFDRHLRATLGKLTGIGTPQSTPVPFLALVNNQLRNARSRGESCLARG